MNTTRLFCLLCLSLVFIAAPSNGMARQPDDSAGFDYRVGRTDQNGNPVYYELTRDYTLNIPAYFSDATLLPKVGQPSALGDTSVLAGIAESWPAIEWDFIRLEKGGILTIKKGYRWDGASRPCKKSNLCFDNWEFDYHYRATLVHDALYDLMRLGYLEPDRVHGDRGDFHDAFKWPFRWVNDVLDNVLSLVLKSQIECYELIDPHPDLDLQDRNRRVADMMFYMISRQEGQGVAGAEISYATIRVGAACRTYNAWSNDDDSDAYYERMFNEQYMPRWKFHPSELTAERLDDGIELSWQVADEAGIAPDKYPTFISGWPVSEYVIEKNGEPIVGDDGNPVTLTPDETSFVDTDVEPGLQYLYTIRPSGAGDETDFGSNGVVAVPQHGPGNALRLGFAGAPESIWAGNTVSNDLIVWEDAESATHNPDHITLEAWVYPYATDGDRHIYSFEYPRTAASGGLAAESIHLSWCGSENRFCVLRYDHSGNEPTKVLSDDQFAPGRWHHVALTASEDSSLESVLYVDGTRQAGFFTTGKLTPWRWDTLSIGGSQLPGGANTFKGLIDEARIWNQAKTADEIQDGMCTTLTGGEDGLAALWQFDNPPDTSDITCFDFNVLAEFFRSIGIEVSPDFPTLKICGAWDATRHSNGLVVLSEFGDVEPIFTESEAMVPKAGTVTVELNGFGAGSVSADQVIATTLHSRCLNSLWLPEAADFSCSDLGSHSIDVKLTDSFDIERDDQAGVEVIDLIAPVVSDVVANPSILRSLDDEMVTVTIQDAFVTDNCRDIGLGSCKIIAVSGNEPLVAAGGPDRPDYDVIDERTVNLRATTSSTGSFRIYTIAIDCTDESGNISMPAVVDVAVTPPFQRVSSGSSSGSGATSLWLLFALLVIAMQRRVTLRAT